MSAMQPMCHWMHPFIDRQGRKNRKKMGWYREDPPQIVNEWVEEDWCDQCLRGTDHYWMRWQPFGEIAGYCMTCEVSKVGVPRR